MNYFNKQKGKFNYPVISMGTFDGVHLGHQKLLKHLTDRAEKTGGEAIVITYYHHPLETIHKKTFPYLLTERHKKERLLLDFGVDCVLYLNFNEKMAGMNPEKFLEDVIIKEVNVKEFVIGYDTHFGKFRKGDYKFLKANKNRYDYKVEMVEPYKIQNRIVSSSLIRDMIREGSVYDVEKYLGRKYSISGNVKTGHKIGRGIGFPTINIQPSDFHKLIPAIGVYLCEVYVNNKMYYGLTNVGYCPTLKDTGIKEVETHLLDFSGNLYGKDVEVFFHKKLRDELLFENENKLIQAIQNDVKEAMKFFGI